MRLERKFASYRSEDNYFVYSFIRRRRDISISIEMEITYGLDDRQL